MNFDFNNITWDQILALLSNPALYIYFGIVLVGTTISALQKSKLEGQANGKFWQWFLTNKRATFFSLLGAVGGFVWLQSENSTDVVGYFGAGYMSDAFFNRAKGLLGIANINKVASGEKPVWKKFFGW